MGCPSAAIVTEELIQLGARNLLRIGTCGGYNRDLRLGDLVIATAATPNDGTVSSIARGLPYAPAAHFDVVHAAHHAAEDRKSTRLNSSHANISYAVFCLKKKYKSFFITCLLYY